MARISRIGFGQVQPNHLSAQRDGRVYAQLPADDTVFTDGILEQGMFVKYDYAANKVNLSGEGEWMLVYNQEKLYDERKQNHKDYAMQADDFADGTMVPRVFGTVVGDIITVVGGIITVVGGIITVVGDIITVVGGVTIVVGLIIGIVVIKGV